MVGNLLLQVKVGGAQTSILGHVSRLTVVLQMAKLLYGTTGTHRPEFTLIFAHLM